MTDFYASNADIYAAVNFPSLSGQLTALRSVVNPPFSGPVVDVGAGIGTVLTTLASLTNDAIYAVEPSAHMRAGLMTTVVGDTSMRSRVTVLPGTLGDVSDQLPEGLGGIVALNMLGHFKPDELQEFWEFTSQRLEPGGQLVVGLQPPFEPVEIPWTDFGESQVGERTYHCAGSASVTSDNVAKWTIRWTVRGKTGAELERREQSTQWAVVGPQQVTEAALVAGLEPSTSDLTSNLFSFKKRATP